MRPCLDVTILIFILKNLIAQAKTRVILQARFPDKTCIFFFNKNEYFECLGTAGILTQSPVLVLANVYKTV